MTAAVFKNTQGRWLTKALFFELSIGPRPYAVFTLKEEDHEVDGVTYWSLRKKFVDCEDPTEYEFANKWLGGWQHWLELQKCEEIAEHIDSWREERDVKMRSKGVRKLVELASAEEASFQAAKWLADKGWEEKQKKGRPSKQDIAKETKKQVSSNNRVNADLERIRSI